MKWMLLTLFFFATQVFAETFDDRGVWHPIQGVTLTAEYVQTVGVIDASDMQGELNVLISGGTANDSLQVTLEIRGMMSPNLADSALSVQIFTVTSAGADDAIAFADTLIGDELFPYLIMRLTNDDAYNSTTEVNLWLYMYPRERLFAGGN